MRTTASRHSTPRKIMGSLAVIAAAAAVAGLGTFGSFTDSTSAGTTVASGVLALELGTPGGPGLPMTTSGFVPGDSVSRPVNLENKGTVALSSVSLATSASPSNALVTDKVNGLQLRLQQCSQRWTTGGTAELPTYSCTGTERTLYAGSVISTAALPTPRSLAVGGEDNVLATLSLPTTAGNHMQGLSTTVSLAFTAVQATGGPR